MKTKKDKPIVTGCEFYEGGWTCNKSRKLGSPYCPHHDLRVQEGDSATTKRMQKARLGKERKKMMRKLLDTSPLRANPGQ